MQPPDLKFEFVTQQGVFVTIRPIRPEDREIERAFVENLSENSRFMRFFASVKTLSPQLLERLINVDFPNEMAFIATVDADGREMEIGVARYAPAGLEDTAEFAVVVADEWHGQGIGRELMRHLLDVAGKAGIRRIEGSVIATNSNMLHFCDDLGFSSEVDVEDLQLLRVAKNL